MSKKISELPQYIGTSQPTGDIPISIGGTTYKIDPSLLLQIKTIEGQTLIGSGDIDLTKSNVGLSNVDNTADIDKPISTATQTALNGKEDVSNKSSSATLGTSDTLYPTQKAVKAYVDSQTTPDATTLIKGKIKLAGDLAGTADAPTVPALANLVPYIGAISDVDLGEFGLKTGNIELDTTPTTAPTTAGSIIWNDTDGTADLILKGGNVVLQIGQENVIRVVNKTATNINLLQANYQAVRVTGAQGQRLKVDLAQATTDLLSAETIGLVTETINNNQEGFVTTNGLVRGINTTGSLQGETWADGDTLYLSPTTSGRITKVKPIAPNHLIIIGYVIHAHATQGSIFVKVDNGYELDELHNVKITTPTENQSLIFTSSTNIWENKTIIEDAINNGITEKAPSQNAVFDALALKQDIITNPITGTGTGTTNKIAKFTGSNIIGESQIFDNGTNVGIGTDTPSATLQIGNGTGVKNILVNGAGINLALGGLSVTFLGFSTGTISSINTSGAVPLGIGTRSTQPLVLGTNNDERMRIDSSGNVGIRTTSPNRTLTIGGTTSAIMSFNASSNRNTTIGSDSVGNFIVYDDTDASYRMVINPSGNVGIGTTSPTAKLHISDTNKIFDYYGNVNIFTSDSASVNKGGSIAFGGQNSTGGTNPYMFAKIQGIKEGPASNYNGALIFGTTSPSSALEEKMRITSSGNVGIGTTSPSEKFHVSGGNIIVNTDQAIGWGDRSTQIVGVTGSGGIMRFDVNDAEKMRITSSGNVGIGTTNPSSSAILHLKSNSKGFLPPTMTTSERNSIGGPENGLVIYNTDSETIDVFTTGGGWKSLSY